MAVTADRVETREGTTRAALIELAGVHKVYRTGKLEYPALRGVDLEIENGDMVAIVGPSASGKSTIMNMITGIDRPTSGAEACARAGASRTRRGVPHWSADVLVM